MNNSKEWGNGSNTCDYSHDTTGEIRRLETGGGAGMLVCYTHYEKEMEFRRERNREFRGETFSLSSLYDLPLWERLPIVNARQVGAEVKK